MKSGSPMPFKYLRDPLWQGCVLLYALNRCVLKPLLGRSFAGGFFHSHLNDLICIAFWVPPMLWLMRRCGARQDDAPPHAHEIVIPLMLWAWVFEWLLPRSSALGGAATSDPLDVLAYTLGAVAAHWFWRRSYGAST